jgi:hypothetical protein
MGAIAAHFGQYTARKTPDWTAYSAQTPIQTEWAKEEHAE